MIEFRNLTKRFGARTALSEVNVVCPHSRLTGIIGPNSCGKSTLVKSFLGLVVPESGEILLNGSCLDVKGEYRSKIGYLPQVVDFPENLSVSEIFELLEKLRKQPGHRKKALVERLGLERTLQQPFGQLSGGAKQKVGAVGALMFDPEVLILDEPTASLDPLAAIEMRKLIEGEIQGKKTILLVSHFLSDVELLAENLVFLLDGKVAFNGLLNDFVGSTEKRRLDDAVVAYFKNHGWVGK